SKSLEQGKHHAAIAVFVHEFVIVTRAVPAAGHVTMPPIGQIGVIEMTCFVPAGHFEAATLDEKEIHGVLGRLLEKNIGSHQERNRITPHFSNFSASAIAARFPPRREIRPPEIPPPIVVSAAVN